jgi:hypothetical protein
MTKYKYELRKISSTSSINNIYEDEIKEDEEKKKNAKRKFNFIPFDSINYFKFDEMRKQLDDYLMDLYKSIRDNSKIEGETFKKTFFNSLENLLIQISLLKDQKLRVTKIDDVYKWYNKKWKFYLDTNNIDKRTKKTIFEKYPLPETYKKTAHWDVNNINENKNRTKIDDIDMPLRFK